MPTQEPLNLYGKGVSKTCSGHLRYSSPMTLRGKYVHRVVVDRLLEVTPYSVRLLIPLPYEVHHMDYNKTNNEPDNLLLLPEAFHSKLTADRSRDDGGRFGRKFFPRWNRKSVEPDWLPGMEVPF